MSQVRLKAASILFSACLVAICLLAPSCARPAQSPGAGSPPEVRAKEQVVAAFRYTIDSRGRKSVSIPGTYFLSPDRTTFAYYDYTEDKKRCVVVNKSEGKHYYSVDQFVFSPDSKRYAYVANGNTAVVDGVEGKTYRGLVAVKSGYGVQEVSVTIRFSPDSKHFAYVALTGSSPTEPAKYVVVVDGVEHRAYNTVLDPSNLRSGPQAQLITPPPAQPGVLFSPVGGRTAYVAATGNAGRFLVVDGVEGKAYDNISDVAFSGDGLHIAYVAMRKNASGWGDYSVVKDGVEGKWYTAMAVFGVALNQDGSSLAYAVQQIPAGQNQHECFAVMNGVEQPVHYEVSDITFSPDGKHLAYVSLDMKDVGYLRSEYRVVLDGADGDLYFGAGWRVNNSGGLKFSPDGRHLAYVAVPANNIRTVIQDGNPGKQYPSVTDLAFSPDSQHVAYLAGPLTAVTDGIEATYPGIEGKPVFSPDARRSAAIVTADQYRKAVAADGGVPGKSYDSVTALAFSPDGRHLGYVVQTSNGKYFTVVDSLEGRQYDRVLTGDEPARPNTYLDPKTALVFDSNRDFHYLALFDDTVYLVRGSVQ